ncbi:MAG: AMP-binding protein [Bilophila wadsworthia]
MRTPKADSMEAQKIFHVWEAIKAPIVADSSNERAFAVLTDMFKGTGATLIASEDLITEARIVDFQEDDRYIPQHDDSAMLQFSSGSTGMPKGARLTHRNLIANIRALRAIEGGTSEDRLVTWLPYFHDFGLFGCHLMPMLAGMDQIKMDPFQFAQRPFLWMEKIHEHRGTITSATNTGIEHLSAYIGLRADRLPEVDLSCLKVWTVGAEMISAESCRILQEQLAPMGLAPHLLMPGYGLTETTLVATCHPRNTPVKTFTLDRKLMVSEQVVRYVPKGEDAAEFTSVGKPVQYCEVRIADKDGKPLPADRVGVVEIRGDNVISDYFDNPEATESSFNGEWFSTGDMGFMDAEGDLCIVGRSKEIIIVRGQNYYPADIEHIALSGMEKAFRLVVACGVYDPREGREIILMFYIPAKKGADAELAQLLHRMNEQVSTLAGFSVDRFIAARQGDIPRTSSGKVMRKALCEGYLNGDFDGKITVLEHEEPVLDPASMDHEQIVLGVWSDVLELPVDAIGRKKNLFRLGGIPSGPCVCRRGLRTSIGPRWKAISAPVPHGGAAGAVPHPRLQHRAASERDRGAPSKIVASSLGIKAEAVSVSAELMPLIGDISRRSPCSTLSARCLRKRRSARLPASDHHPADGGLPVAPRLLRNARGRRRGLLSADAFSGNAVFPPQRLRAERAERPELLHLPQRPHGRRLPARRV